LSVMPERTRVRRWGGEAIGKAPNDVGGVGIVLEASDGPPARVQHGRVVAPAERTADLGEAVAGVLAREVHGDLARPRHTRGAARGQQVVRGDREGVRDELLDSLDGRWRARAGRMVA